MDGQGTRRAASTSDDEKDIRMQVEPSDGAAQTPAIRLIATDIDGTLLNSDNVIPPVNHQALSAALALGVQIALVTARKQSSTCAVARMLALPCACIAHNGARIWDWNQRELQHLVIDYDLAREIARFADRHAIPMVMTVNEVNYYTPGFPFTPSRGAVDEQRVSSCEAALVAPPTRVIAAGVAGVDALCSEFGAAPDSVVVHRYYSREGSVASAVLTHPRANKADAVALLARSVDVQADEVLALGDAEADAGMLRWAGVGVAMGNAMPEARAAATWIAPSHDDHGFAAAVERFVLMARAPQ